jgi:pimeloyl-ACP methyl ester carboxylesterase
MKKKTRQNFIRRTPAQLANFNANANNRTTVSEMSLIEQPTLVIRGVDTSLYDMRMSEIVANKIPEAKFLIIEDAGHMSPLTHPERITQEILKHIEGMEISA